MSSLVVEWCELAGDHGATGAAHGQALAECSPPQPGTQHLAPCAPDGGVVPAGVVVSLLGTGCCHA